MEAPSPYDMGYVSRSENCEGSDSDSIHSFLGLTDSHHAVMQPVLQGEGGQLHYQDLGEKGDLQELTLLNNSDMKYQEFDFHAEFHARPVCLSSVISSQPGTHWSDNTLTTSFSHLPSFTDTYTPSVITTIEPRAFGEEAEYMSRLKRRESSERVELKRRESSESVETTRSSVIVSVGVQEVKSRDSSPSQPHSISTLLPPHPFQYDFLCSEPLVETMARDSDGCHLTLKTEPEVASPYYQPHSPATQHSSSPVLPNFLQFTPDQSVLKGIGQQSNSKLLNQPVTQSKVSGTQTK